MRRFVPQEAYEPTLNGGTLPEMAEDRGPSDEELEQKLRKLLGEGDEVEPGWNAPPLEGIDDRIVEIEDKARTIRSRNPTPEPHHWKLSKTQPTGRKASEDSHYRSLGVGLTLAYAFVGPTIAGYGIGWLLDRRAGATNQAQTWGTLIGLFLGFGAAMILLLRTDKTEPKP